MSAPDQHKSTGNFITDNPGITSMIVATLIGVGFILALYFSVSGHSGGHGEGHHGAAPAATAHH